MQCRLTRDDLEVSWPGGHESLPAHLREQTETREVLRNGHYQPVTFWKRGAILAFPDCFMLVRMGVAEPVDEACMQRARMTPDSMLKAAHAYERMVRGILPSDFELYDRGAIVGYEPDGSYTPGPNWAEYQAELNAVEDDEDDE